MANVSTGDPFIVDTATDTAITSDGFYCYAIHWASASIGHTAIVNDEDGTNKWKCVAGIDNDSKFHAFPSDRPLYFNGLKVPTLGGGTIYLYVKPAGKR